MNEKIKTKVRTSGKVVVHTEEEVVFTKVVIVEKEFVEIFLSVEKVIEILNVITLKRRLRIVA